MIKIALVDDDALFLESASRMIGEMFSSFAVEHTLERYGDPDAFWSDFAREPADLVFLDIILPGVNGIELARKIHAHAPRTLIVFLTVSPDFAMHGYGVNAIGYLLKPVEEEKMRAVVKDAFDRLSGGDVFVTLKKGGETRRFKADDILYLSSSNRHVHVHCHGDTATVFGKLSETEPLLPPGFVRVHQSFIINLKHAVSMKSYRVFLKDGTILPISRPFRKNVSSAFFDSIVDEF